jgi:hypothetical protein
MTNPPPVKAHDTTAGTSTTNVFGGETLMTMPVEAVTAVTAVTAVPISSSLSLNQLLQYRMKMAKTPSLSAMLLSTSVSFGLPPTTTEEQEFGQVQRATTLSSQDRRLRLIANLDMALSGYDHLDDDDDDDDDEDEEEVASSSFASSSSMYAIGRGSGPRGHSPSFLGNPKQ